MACEEAADRLHWSQVNCADMSMRRQFPPVYAAVILVAAARLCFNDFLMQRVGAGAAESHDAAQKTASCVIHSQTLTESPPQRRFVLSNKTIKSIFMISNAAN